MDDHVLNQEHHYKQQHLLKVQKKYTWLYTFVLLKMTPRIYGTTANTTFSLLIETADTFWYVSLLLRFEADL